MSKVIDSLDDELRTWIAAQRIFFIGSAPLAAEGHVNCSPRGGDCLRLLNDREVVFRDLTGSGAETAAHVRENGRLVIMFCAFEGKPRILRFHGQATLTTPDDARCAEFDRLFPEDHPGRRAYFHLRVQRIATSCGYSVPFMDFRAHRDVLDKWSHSKGKDGVAAFRNQHNITSIDGLPAFDAS